MKEIRPETILGSLSQIGKTQKLPNWANSYFKFWLAVKLHSWIPAIYSDSKLSWKAEDLL